jgi:hypothetical protein
LFARHADDCCSLIFFVSKLRHYDNSANEVKQQNGSRKPTEHIHLIRAPVEIICMGRAMFAKELRRIKREF